MWALGWHQCKWGYRNTEELEDVVKAYEDNNLPLDVQWTDIDYMEEYKDFTVDMENFGNLSSFVDGLHKKNMYYVPIVDAGIAQRVGGNYSVYNDGVE